MTHALENADRAEFVTERVNLCDQLKRNDSYGVIYGRNVTWTGKGSLRDVFYVRGVLKDALALSSSR